MKETVLENIIADKLQWIVMRQTRQPLASFQYKIIASNRSFYAALQKTKPAFILECKKASPSKGLIRKNFDPASIALAYKDFAAVISVLTDEKYFQGSVDFLSVVSNTVMQPVLCKDIIIDPYQIYLARLYSADAILLMLSVLNNEQYRQLSDVAHDLNMGILTEVVSEEELERALALGAQVIGINNRDLHDLSIDLDRTRQLAMHIPPGITVISESGINQYSQIRKLNQYVNGFLIGSALMMENNIRDAICRVILGENKICGLTRPQDAAAAYKAGAIYGGLIFINRSERYISMNHAYKVIAGAGLKYVGIFCNEHIQTIVDIAECLSLQAIQLHGSEDQVYINNLRHMLPDYCQIWKALNVKDRLPSRNIYHIDRFVLDNGAGGTGKCFNWSILQNEDLSNVILAGGLGVNNCMQATKLGCAGLDFNSGVEIEPGIKDVDRLNTVFQILRSC
ncbi:indole-3-glycerol phosphate synthase (IGPS) / N-(5'-phospho-ribosyl)anthranilate isomerase (PRAI) [Serratia symbiotica str. 'Cinara cedri']|uniref:Multifunctional fusion protein n=1 Tax=Serratia symbiotica TaxID=138074 RepID=B4YQR5_9GAMM|nr:indole-3-glycerol-phosphate synthase/phosphoribosylanthranilate [Serratia symbiotica]AEW44530.1 indole-3-glycerol phosphate synthase (IGPS) / N-(5'-phospho-ribosyl)anthranilate isomerase (PRAI) [Serratia symbiotica str. 'Cinara cedri']